MCTVSTVVDAFLCCVFAGCAATVCSRFLVNSSRIVHRPCTPTQYASEAVASLAEAPPPRAADVPAAVEVAGVLHRTYPEFGAALGPALAKAFSSRLAGGECSVVLRVARNSSVCICHAVAGVLHRT